MRNEIRCGNCNRLLGKGQAYEIQIKCPRCGTMNHLIATSADPESPRASTEDSYEDTDRQCDDVQRRGLERPEGNGRREC
ncbi:MAG: Com family DNA-binding transcriptional regulator [Pseudodesulfovibrio sp.]|uniref:Com family DNA-binding transcriptional regulator n=1 Tax=Pseudodesulfovibrio sp. TaxID=2035812 RepID=UPI003D0CE19A